MPRLAVLAVVLGLLALGCAPATQEEKPANKDRAPAAPSPAAQETPRSGDGEAALDIAQIPEKLKHQAFRYLGLGATEPVNFKLTMTGAAEARSGGQVAKLIRLDENEAIFRVERTGEIGESLGTDELAVRPDGVYGIKTSVGTMSGERLELPANLTPGAKWKSSTTLTTNDGQRIQLTIDNVVLPARKVTTPAGTFEAIVVQGTGNGDFNGEKRTLKTESFYVLDKGMAKMKLTTEAKGQAPSSITIERVP
jgi:hypothetical protein